MVIIGESCTIIHLTALYFDNEETYHMKVLLYANENKNKDNNDNNK